MASGLWVDLYELTMASVYFERRKNIKAVFELFIRSSRRPFYLLFGVREALNYAKSLRFSQEDISFLRSLELFSEDFLAYLKKFKFSGNIFSQSDGSIVFAREPLLRVEADLIEAQILESALLNIINVHTTLATKSARVVLAAKGRKIYDFSLRRTLGREASLIAAKSAYLAGAGGTSNILAGKLYGIPVVGTMAHSFVMSFSREIEAFKLFVDKFPGKAILLLDTYDLRNGLNNAVHIAKYLKKNYKSRLLGVRIDSGDLIEQSKYIRSVLDFEGLVNTLILASGDLDEYKIKKLISANAPIDAFGVGTNMGVSSDLPFTDAVYKICGIRRFNENFLPVMKLSQKKSSLPFAKQVIRSFGRKVMEKDTIYLDKGSNYQRGLLKKVMAKGEVTTDFPDLESLRKSVLKNLSSLPQELKDLNDGFQYPVILEPKLKEKINSVRSLISKRALQCSTVFFDIDTQFDFLSPEGRLYVPHSEEILPKIKRLLKFAEEKGILVISSADSHKKNDPEFEKFPAHCLKNSRGSKKLKETLLKKYISLSLGRKYSWEYLEQIKGSYAQIIIEKNALNLFTVPAARELLDIIFPCRVYVFGVATEYCVKEAVLTLAGEVDEVFVVEDAVKEVNIKEKDKTFLQFRKNNVKFIDTESVLKMSD